MTPETVLRETDAGIAEADRLVALAVDPTQSRTFDNTLLTLSDAAAAVWIAEGRGALIGEVHPDAAIRDAADTARERIDRWRNALVQRDDVAAAVRAFADTPDAAALPDRRRRILDLWLRDLRRAGHGLAPATRAELATLRERIVELSARFGRHLREWSESVELEADALDGLSGSFLDQLPAGGSPGSKSLPIVPSTILPFLEQSSRRDLRELVLTKLLGKAAAENGPILDEILGLRRRIAALMGAASWSDYANELRMSGSAAAVDAFLGRVLPPLQVLATGEQAAMHALLVADGIDDELRAWDWLYYHERQRRSTGLDSSALAEHFPLEAVLDGLFALVRDVFGVAVAEVAAPGGWHPDVRGFVLSDVATGEHLGMCYVDLLARQGKSPGAWVYPLDPGLDRAGSPRRPPVQHLVMNITPAAEGAQPLLPHIDVFTLFHEFGHALEFLLQYAEMCWVNLGSWTERDFIEAPSQIMEHWAWSPEVLRRFARHHRTGAPVPEALLAPLAASRRLNIGTVMLWFVGYKAVLDQALHGPEAVDLTDAYRKAFEVTGFPFVEGTLVPASFFHIVTATYDAGYYGYLWAEAIGDDMFTAFRSGGIFSAEVGRRYREAVLEPGWLVPGRDRVRQFLGRDSSEAAYLERLGIGGTAGRAAEEPADAT
jgi:thimet oligopeptidase